MRACVVWIVALMAGLTLGLGHAGYGAAESGGSAGGSAATRPSPEQKFKLGVVLTQTDSETVFNVFRIAHYALDQGDDVSVFLLGKGVELEQIKDPKFDVQEKARTFTAAGGKIFACGTCLRMRGSAGSELCPISTLEDLYRIIRASDRVLTF
jgi:sulfur relay (sulfurtransferase) complex TusBCD TusD component (DsrE family)